MEQALEGADAVHRIKRGRSAKAAEVVEGADVPDVAGGEMVVFGPLIEGPYGLDENRAQAYALRIWHGQSVDLSIPDRVERVVNGLRGQGMSIAVDLPHPDAARFLAKYE